MLLGIPIPSVFVSQRDDGVWDVVDGLQRLSTIFEFMGILRDENNALFEGSTLVATPHLPSLEGKKWENPQVPENELDTNLKLEFKRVKIDIKIVKKQSDKNVKYELFQRINTLGTRLSDQEVRNCLLIMINKGFYFWLKELSTFQPFLETLSLADRLIDEQYHMELALRFFIYKNINLDEIKGVYDLADFITQKMIEYADSPDFNAEIEKDIFTKTFTYLNETIGDDAFKRFNTDKQIFQGRFLLSMYETIAVGVGKNILLNNLTFSNQEVKDKVSSVWNNQDFQNRTGSGVSVSSRLPVLIPLGENLFKQRKLGQRKTS